MLNYVIISKICNQMCFNGDITKPLKSQNVSPVWTSLCISSRNYHTNKLETKLWSQNEPESLQDYDDVGNATARAPTSPNQLDDHTSEGEVEINFPQVKFTVTPRRQTTNRDSSSSHEEESLYSNVRIWPEMFSSCFFQLPRAWGSLYSQ